MVIVRLMGGLGNQLFQYATAKKISLLYETSLKLDLFFLQNASTDVNFTQRSFELDNYKISAGFAAYDEVKSFYKSDIMSTLWRRSGQVKHVKEKSLRFDSSLFNAKKDIYLNGYWQSEKYFSNIRSTLVEEFQPTWKVFEKAEGSATFRDILARIMDSESVSVHFRRGDYVNNAQTNKYHGICSNDYYVDAMNLMAQKLRNPLFFIFSDEPLWVSTNFNITGLKTVLMPVSSHHLDLLLMRNCKHNIIANSSYSWWAAWLNQNPEKIVISPSKWFAKKQMNDQTSDLVPDSWIRI